jgi:hypothetical protein
VPSGKRLAAAAGYQGSQLAAAHHPRHPGHSASHRPAVETGAGLTHCHIVADDINDVLRVWLADRRATGCWHPLWTHIPTNASVTGCDPCLGSLSSGQQLFKEAEESQHRDQKTCIAVWSGRVGIAYLAWRVACLCQGRQPRNEAVVSSRRCCKIRGAVVHCESCGALLTPSEGSLAGPLWLADQYRTLTYAR